MPAHLPGCQPGLLQCQKSPPASAMHYIESQSQPHSQSKTWIFFQLGLKSNHGMGAACARGQVCQGLVAFAVSGFQMSRQN